MSILKNVPGIDLFLKAADLSTSSIGLKILPRELKNLLSFQQLLLDLIPSPIFYKDADCIYRGGNKSFEKYIGLTRKQFIGKTVYEISPADLAAQYDKADRELLASSGIQTYESKVLYADGTIHDVMFRKSTLRNDDDTVVGIIGVILDISERKASEEKIRQLLAEKEIIMKEVHHRIKNNMTTISELLHLQADTVKDPSASAALKDACIRVQSMAILYDKLFQSVEFKELSARTYLIPLIDQIVSNFSGSADITVEKHIEDFQLDAKRLQTLGIIINEVITNIMKHAFRGRNSGIITISASLTENIISVIINDNGVGIPESVTFDNSPGFGLTLVAILIQQISGTVRIERRQGTSIILEFVNTVGG